MNFLIVLREFWEARPAFYLGLQMLLGVGFAYYPHYALGLPLLLLWLPFVRQPVKVLQGIIVIVLSVGYALYRYPDQQIPQQVHGKAYFAISAVKPYQSPFHRTSLAYQGIIHYFETKEKSYYDLPCTIYHDKEVPAGSDYLIEGELIEKGNRRYVLKPTKDMVWKKVAGTFSFALWRYKIKEKLRTFLKQHTPEPKTLSFLSALATGDITERTLNFEFKQIGLLHVLAISGFQFALIAAFFGFFLRPFLPYKTTFSILLVLLTAYYFFLGPSPSVQRSYIAVLLFFVGSFLKISSSGLNLLGMGLIVELIFDPLLVTNLGFELTFLCTAAILLFYRPCLKLFSLLLPKRNYHTVLAMGRIDQHGYLFASWIREALAINIAVHLVSLPALL
ncbi:MAG TPA: ComEC/Rec2 family competence protein, partial [Rhabdochlamydiaceae bacterium]|nr:ComEC/Rec2 family competence protein [Rhabdochlamydiaceae bacterium]